MLKILVILVAVLIAAVNISASTNRLPKGLKRVPKAGVVRVGPPTTYLKEGLTSEEVIGILGNPIASSERDERGVIVTTHEFQRGANRVLVAEFVNGELVHSRTEIRTALVALSR